MIGIICFHEFKNDKQYVLFYDYYGFIARNTNSQAHCLGKRRTPLSIPCGGLNYLSVLNIYKTFVLSFFGRTALISLLLSSPFLVKLRLWFCFSLQVFPPKHRAMVF